LEINITKHKYSFAFTTNLLLKILPLIGKVLLSFIFLPLLILTRILRPIILIRFGYFHIQRIGHFAFDLEFYLAEKELNNHKNSYDIFFLSGKPCNDFLYKICRRQIICINRFSFILYLNKLLPFSKAHEYIPAIERSSSRDVEGVFKKTSNKLIFLKEEQNAGNNFLKSIGLNKKTKFVCLAVRDSAYLKEEFPGKDFSDHNYRDSKIENYIDSIKYLNDRGYFVFRMGKKVSEKLELNSDLFLDYANSSVKSDFLDIWLMANCHFAISTGTGIDEVSNIFRKPICYLNFSPITIFNSYNPKAITTPKKIHDGVSKYISLRQQIKEELTDIDSFQTIKYLLEENSKDEILDSIKEIEQKIKNGWIRSDEEIKLQENFWKIIYSWKMFKKYHHEDSHINSGTISDAYLKKNKEWLF
tara:strand:+ start:2591 stop:3838 length:1248 start_codon:yes stop_codon:yes gene_type:complete